METVHSKFDPLYLLETRLHVLAKFTDRPYRYKLIGGSGGMVEVRIYDVRTGGIMITSFGHHAKDAYRDAYGQLAGIWPSILERYREEKQTVINRHRTMKNWEFKS